MHNPLKVAIIGLDTSHAIEFGRAMADPNSPADHKVESLKAVSCLRFDTPFQNEEGLNKRQETLESWGIPVTLDFDTAVKDCDAIMLEINDPAFHLEYFNKVAELGKPLFIDKPLADTIENGKIIYDKIKSLNLRAFSASSLRFVPELDETIAKVEDPIVGYSYGPLGIAPAGSSIVWYGVHAFEMLERMMGLGAKRVTVSKTSKSAVCTVEYNDDRHGIVDLTIGSYFYGGCLRGKSAHPFTVNMANAYPSLLKNVEAFFLGAEAPVSMEDTLEVMAMLDAAEKSYQTGKSVDIEL